MIKKRLVMLLMILVSVSVFSETVPTKKETLKLIERFKKEKDFSVESLKKYAKIINYAVESDDVYIKLSAKTMPWMGNDKLDTYSPVFLMAFIAGNLEAQLKLNVKMDKPYEGILMVIAVYKKMKNKNNDLVIEEIEFLIEKEKNKELLKYLTE